MLEQEVKVGTFSPQVNLTGEKTHTLRHSASFHEFNPKKEIPDVHEP